MRRKRVGGRSGGAKWAGGPPAVLGMLLLTLA